MIARYSHNQTRNATIYRAWAAALMQAETVRHSGHRGSFA